MGNSKDFQKENNKRIGARIRDIRLSLSESNYITLEGFGKMLTPVADKAVVSNWEKGKNLPNLDRLEQISKIGNISIDYIMTGRKTSGYGERIKNIRINIMKLTSSDFGKLFSPNVLSSVVDGWETESLLPSFEQVIELSRMGNIEINELIFGKKFESEETLELKNKIVELESKISKIINFISEV